MVMRKERRVPLTTERQRVQHLLRRTTFGVTVRELEEYVALGVAGSVERLLHPEAVDDSAAEAMAAEAAAPFALDPADDEVKRQQRAALFRKWYLRLTFSRRPLLERMTYFWHDHFATAISKVASPLLMHRQNEMLREHALGSFEALLLAVTRDPAMMIYLDNRSNARTAPNENYARELLELHTLGEGGGYTERDIKEAARALTGWRIQDNAAVFRAQQHDPGKKTVLGQTGNFDDAGLIALLARHPGTATYIADKLVRFFVRPGSEPGLVKRAADVFTRTNGDIREVLRVILLSPGFFEAASYRAIVKAPIELVIGATRALEVPTDGTLEVDATRRIGQTLFDPPNPAGWPGGPAWVNATTVLTRANYASELTRLKTRHTVDVPALLRANGVTGSAAAVVDFLLDLLTGGDVPASTRAVLIDHIGGSAHFDFEQAARAGTLHGVLYLILSMPLYQVL
jgi:uncharacterized protein (DUF1800 family)